MIISNNSKLITFKRQYRLGSHEEQPLLFSLVQLKLYYEQREGEIWIAGGN